MSRVFRCTIGRLGPAVALALVALACRENPKDEVVADSGSFGGSAGTSGTGGSGAGGSGNCPLDAIGKERLRIVYQAALEDAEYVASSSHEIGPGASRGHGTRVPFTSLNLRKTTTVSETCSAPKSFAPSCAAPEPGASGSFARCVELACEAAGVLLVRTWIEPLPAEVFTDPPPGTTRIEELESSARFSEGGDGSIAVTLDGFAKLALADGAVVRRSIGGDLLNDAPGGETLDVLSNIDGIAQKTVALDATREGGTLSGDVIVEGVSIATIDENGISFVADCAE